MSFVFADPPPVARPDGRTYKTAELARFADALRDLPGEWALYPLPVAKGSACRVAYWVRAGRWSPGGGFDATARGGQVYVRYVGTEDAK